MIKIKFIAIAGLIVVLASPHHAEAWCWWKCSSKTTKITKTVTVTPTPAPTPAPAPTPTPVVTPTPPAAIPAGTAPGELVMSAYTTGYTYYDNDPPGSAAISNPVVHSVAGGSGTYADPITIAVGFTSVGPDITPGTRFYIPNLRRYFIVEDTCAACHPGSQGYTWLDLWIDGSRTTNALANTCANALTRVNAMIKNPRSTYPVVAGVLSSTSCATQYGDLLP